MRITSASSIRTSSVRLYGDDGDHGGGGGKGTLAGPVVGGLIFGLLPVILRPIMAPEAQWIVYGAILILILFLMPRGIAP